MLASLMNPSLQLHQMQSILAVDPTLLLGQPTSSSATGGSTLSSSGLNISSVAKPPSTAKKAPSKGRLNAVVEKLSSNQCWMVFTNFLPIVLMNSSCFLRLGPLTLGQCAAVLAWFAVCFFFYQVIENIYGDRDNWFHSACSFSVINSSIQVQWVMGNP